MVGLLGSHVSLTTSVTTDCSRVTGGSRMWLLTMSSTAWRVGSQPQRAPPRLKRNCSICVFNLNINVENSVKFSNPHQTGKHIARRRVAPDNPNGLSIVTPKILDRVIAERAIRKDAWVRWVLGSLLGHDMVA